VLRNSHSDSERRRSRHVQAANWGRTSAIGKPRISLTALDLAVISGALSTSQETVLRVSDIEPEPESNRAASAASASACNTLECRWLKVVADGSTYLRPSGNRLAWGSGA
jgi:hypothetical protein